MRPVAAGSVGPAFAVLVLVSACADDPQAPDPNLPPETAFLADSECPPVRDLSVCWGGADSDGFVVGYERQLLLVDDAYFASRGDAGAILAVLEPGGGAGTADWTPTENVTSRTVGSVPGRYVLRVRARDDDGAVDPSPAERWIDVAPPDDSPPFVEILSACGRLDGAEEIDLLVDASDEDGAGLPRPRTAVEWRARLATTSTSGAECAVDETWSAWARFPAGDAPVVIHYDGLAAGSGCRWEFRIEARDPAGDVGEATCELAGI